MIEGRDLETDLLHGRRTRRQAGVSETVRKTFHSYVFGINSNQTCQDDACSICLVSYSTGDEIMQMPCGHIFHRPCISTWMNGHSDCPLCKANLNVPLASTSEGGTTSEAAASLSLQTFGSSSANGSECSNAARGEGGGEHFQNSSSDTTVAL